MKKLPLEVVSCILSNLDPKERLSAGLVSREWMEATELLMDDICLTLHHSIPLAPMTGRIFRHVNLISMNIDDQCVDFLNHLGPNLLHLRLAGCIVSCQKMVVACHRLKVLHLENTPCDALLIFATLPHLRDLDLKGALDLTEEQLMVFDEIAAPNLERFAMPNNLIYKEMFVAIEDVEEGVKDVAFQDVEEDIDDGALMDVEEGIEEVALANPPPPEMLSSAALEAFVGRRAASLTTLHFQKTITPNAALRFSKVSGLRLRGVSFASCDQGIAKIFPEFFEHQPGIVALNVDKIDSLHNQHLIDICHRLPELCHFSARQSFGNLNWGLIWLFGLRHLQSLCLTSYNFAMCAFSRAILEIPFPTLELRKLDLSNTRAPDFVIRALLSRTPRLEELNLTGCFVSDATLTFICPLLPRLRALSLMAACKKLGDVGLRGICLLSKIETLDLSFCQLLTSDGFIEFVHSLRHLRKLNLKYCLGVPLNIRERLFEHNPFLTLWYHKDPSTDL